MRTGDDELDLARREVVHTGVGQVRAANIDRDLGPCGDLLADARDGKAIPCTEPVVIERVYEGER